MGRIDGIEVTRPLLDVHLTNLRDMAFEIPITGGPRRPGAEYLGNAVLIRT